MSAPGRGLSTAAWVGLVAWMLLVVFGSALNRPGLGPQAAVAAPRVLDRWVDATRSTPVRVLGDGKQAAIVRGVVFGQPAELSAHLRDAFRRSGLWHLLAASGQNIALVVAITVWAAIAIGGTRVHGLVASLGTIPLYVLLVGGGPSIMRAAIMGILGVSTWLLSGRIAPLTALVWAAVVLELAFPRVHTQLGFQLSFACVVGLVTLAPSLARRMSARGLPSWLAGGAAATVTCQLATAPILLLQIGEAPLIGGVSNLVGVPLAGLILVLGLVAVLVGWVVPPAAEALLAACGACASVLGATAELAAALPMASAGPLAWSCLAVAGCGIWQLSRTTKGDGSRPRRVLWIGVVVFSVALPAVAHRTGGVLPGGGLPEPAAGDITIDVLDVGQGDAILVRSRGESLLVDTGPDASRLRRALKRVAATTRPDNVAITHDHADHAGGLAGVQPRGEVGRSRPEGGTLCAGGRLHVGAAEVEVVAPPCSDATHAHADPNLHSLVLLVHAHGRAVLLTGDAESMACGCAALGRVDVLKVAHHGSADPGLDSMLRRLAPKAAIISVGEENTYGHPHPSTTTTLQHAGVPSLRTDEHGDIRIQVTRSGALYVRPRNGDLSDEAGSQRAPGG